MAKRFDNSKGPSQRQLRAGELVRHALVDILAREGLRDPAFDRVMISVTEVRPSPDLRSAKVYVAPLGSGDAKALATALNKSAGFLRGRLGKEIDMKFTPELHFHADTSFDAASELDSVLSRPGVKRDLDTETPED